MDNLSSTHGPDSGPRELEIAHWNEGASFRLEFVRRPTWGGTNIRRPAAASLDRSLAALGSWSLKGMTISSSSRPMADGHWLSTDNRRALFLSGDEE